jgi:hypothetical protein
MKTTIAHRASRLAGLILATGAGLSATTINFDDQVTQPSGIAGVALTNQYASEGVMFSLIDASQSFKSNVTPTSGPNYASPFFDNTGPGSFIFVNPANTLQNASVSQVSFTLLGLTSTMATPGNFSGATIEALDLSGNVISGQTEAISATSVTTSNEVLTFTGQVHEILFIQTGGTSGVLPFDDVTFGTVTPSPEPGTLALLGSALMLMLAGRAHAMCSPNTSSVSASKMEAKLSEETGSVSKSQPA